MASNSPSRRRNLFIYYVIFFERTKSSVCRINFSDRRRRSNESFAKHDDDHSFVSTRIDAFEWIFKEISRWKISRNSTIAVRTVHLPQPLVRFSFLSFSPVPIHPLPRLSIVGTIHRFTAVLLLARRGCFNDA